MFNNHFLYEISIGSILIYFINHLNQNSNFNESRMKIMIRYLINFLLTLFMLDLKGIIDFMQTSTLFRLHFVWKYQCY